MAHGFSPRRWRRFLDAGGAPALLGRAPRELAATLSDSLGIGRSEAVALARALARVDPRRERARAAAAGIDIATWERDAYPAALRDLVDPPPAVFVRGTLLESDKTAVAIVGSRRATPYGLRVARTLATDLARAGVTIVSGLARGIDAAAHEGALAAGGRTIAVLGSGLQNVYPPEHAGLLDQVVESGAAVSEFRPDAPPARANFPRRNRLVAALGLAVIVVEAATRSGAMNTVGHALDLGRTVMAVPGPVHESVAQGTLRMLQDGAAPVGSAADVFAALGWCGMAKKDLPDEEHEVLQALEDGSTALQVAEALDLGEERVAGYLVSLELRGLVHRGEGGAYRVI